MKSFSTFIPVSVAVILAAMMAWGCRETVGASRPTVPFVEQVLGEKGRYWSLVSGFNPDNPRGSIALVGPADRNMELAGCFLKGDVFDNIDGRLAPDDLPEIDKDRIGIHGSPTNVVKSFVPVLRKGGLKIKEETDRDSAVRLFSVLTDAHII